MNFRTIYLIGAKELLDYSRDRRCLKMLAGLFLLLILLPLIFSFVAPPGTASQTTIAGAANVYAFAFPVLICIIACINMGIDITTGETERGSLEVTLCMPVSPRELVLGKCLAVMVFSATAMLLYFVVAGIETGLNRVIPGITGHPLFFSFIPRLTAGAVVANLALLLQASCFFSSAAILLGFFSKSIKEAMSSYGVMFFFLLLPGLAAAKGWHLNGVTALVPILNCSLLAPIQEITASTVLLGLEILASTLGFIWAANYLSVRLVAGDRLLKAF